MMILGCILVIIYYIYIFFLEKENELSYLVYLTELYTKNHHEERVYAIDFDDTIAITEFPKIIKPIPYAIEVLQALTKDPYSTLILWTCREGEYLEQALKFCDSYGIKFDYVNENCKRNLDLYITDCRKISADVYIDDHSYQGIEGVKKLWKGWYMWMKENKLI